MSSSPLWMRGSLSYRQRCYRARSLEIRWRSSTAGCRQLTICWTFKDLCLPGTRLSSISKTSFRYVVLRLKYLGPVCDAFSCHTSSTFRSIVASLLLIKLRYILSITGQQTEHIICKNLVQIFPSLSILADVHNMEFNQQFLSFLHYFLYLVCSLRTWQIAILGHTLTNLISLLL